jgi:hypothetical protein
MEGVVAPFDQIFPVAAEEVSTTFPPEQKVVGPLAVIVGTVAVDPTDTTIGAEVSTGQPPTVLETV